MTEKQAASIAALRRQKMSLSKIAVQVGLSINTVKSWCYRHPIEEADGAVCVQCGGPLLLKLGSKQKRFCSDRCRAKWWSAHPEARKLRKPYAHICRFCHSVFETNRQGSAYCSIACYSKARQKGAPNG